MGYATTRDASAARWLEDRLTAFDGTVAGVVPGGFAAYARVLHPAYRDDAPVTWAEIAGANGRTAHPLMQWDHIVGTRKLQEQPGLWDEAPYEGNVPEPVLRRLAQVLRERTATPGTCWFGLWIGWGGTALAPDDTARFEIPDREMLLLTGPLDTVHRTSLSRRREHVYADDPSVAVAVAADSGGPGGPGGPGAPGDPGGPGYPGPGDPGAQAPQEDTGRDPFWRAPGLWWPDDRSWCVATDVDFPCTYVGGSESCVDALLAADGVEAYRAYAIDPVTDESDHVNPRPAPRR